MWIDPKYIQKQRIYVKKLQKEMREYIHLGECKRIIICKQGIIVYIEYTLSVSKIPIFSKCILFQFQDIELEHPAKTLFEYLSISNTTFNIDHIYNEIALKREQIIELEKELRLYQQFKEKMIHLRMLEPQKVGEFLL